MSDDSDRASDLASEHDEADDLELDEDQSESESEAEDANGFLDIEASESNEESEDEMGSDVDEDEIHFFPQFCRLPIELREQIWQFFDPDLKSPGRVLEFQFIHPTGSRDFGFELWESATLEQQTAPARAMLATHRESRLMALKSYPHTLPLRGNRGGVIRFNGDSDIIYIPNYSADDTDMAAVESEMGVLDPFKDIKYLAIDEDQFTPSDPQTFRAIDEVREFVRPVLTNVKTWFYVEDAVHFPAWKLRWCASDKVRKFYLQTEEEEPGVGEDLEFLYCWPDVKQHDEHEFAQDNITIKLREQHIHEQDDEEDEVTRDNIIEKRHHMSFNGLYNIEAYPLIRFSFEDGLRKYHKIREAVHSGGDIGGSWTSFLDGSESGSDQDEYESDGIDDATIDESDNSGEDEDDDLALGHPKTDDPSIFDSFSPLEPESPGAYDPDGPASYEEPVPTFNGFSPLEPDSPGVHTSDESASDEEPVRGVKRRRRIVASDSEDEDALEDRPRKRHVHAVSDSDDDEEDDDVVPHSRRPGRALKSNASLDEDLEEASDTEVSEDRLRKRRTRAVIDSEDEDEDDGTEVGEQNGVGLDSDSDEESEDDSDEEQDQRRTQSLAERLQLFRSQNPVSPSQSESDLDSDNDDMAGGYEGDDYDGFEDGEGVDEFDECGEEGDGQILDMDDQYPDESHGEW